MTFRTIAISTDLADKVRTRRTSPGYGHPAPSEAATGHGPCRHCLRTFRIGEERRILFTLDPFWGLETLPLPGPVYIHEDHCERYAEDGGFPEELRSHALTLEAFARGRKRVAEEHIAGPDVETAIERLLARSDVDYIHVRDTEAGCYDLRIEHA